MIQTIAPGTRFLDTNYPGWFKAIDLETLDMSSTSDCVIGQMTLTEFDCLVFDDDHYSAGCAAMGINENGLEAQRYGFVFSTWNIQSYAQLTNRWTAAIERRLAKERVS